jgi:hypothetical protein
MPMGSRSTRATFLAVLCCGALLGADMPLSPAAAIKLAGHGTGGRPRFANITREMNVSTQRTRTWGSVVFDYDLDGDADILINRHLGKAYFYENRGSNFKRKRFRGLSGPPRLDRYYDRHSCGWGEANHDGLPDLYCVSGAQKGLGTGPNQLLIRKGSTFVDRSARFRVTNRRGRGRSLNWLFANRDQALDLFIGNGIREGFPNLLLRRSRSRFRRVRAGVAQEMNVSASIWADWDRDGDPDLLVIGEGALGTLAYRNTRSGFTPVSLGGVTRRAWLSGAWGDFNGDGRIDLVMVSSTRLEIFTNRRGRLRRVHGMNLTAGRAAAWFDVENDGDLDLFVVRARANGTNQKDFFLVREHGEFRTRFGGSFAGPGGGDGDSVSTGDVNGDGRVDLVVTNGTGRSRGRIQLLRNRTSAGNWLTLHLRAGRKNPVGFGARVRVRAGSRFVHRFVTDGVGYRGQSDAPVHVGLANRKKARIKVWWPNGRSDCFTGSANEHVVVRKGKHPCN